MENQPQEIPTNTHSDSAVPVTPRKKITPFRVGLLIVELVLGFFVYYHRETIVDALSGGTPSVVEQVLPVVPVSMVPIDQSVQYEILDGKRATISGKMIAIRDGQTILTQNNTLVRLPDESRDCPSDGFQQIVSKGVYFTVEQQTCDRTHFINEYTTFLYDPSDTSIVLYRFGRQYINRNDPDKDITEKVLTSQDFGVVPFDKLDLSTLYKL